MEAGALLLSMDVRSFELELFENPLTCSLQSSSMSKSVADRRRGAGLEDTGRPVLELKMGRVPAPTR